jgi:hypothetical protein
VAWRAIGRLPLADREFAGRIALGALGQLRQSHPLHSHPLPGCAFGCTRVVDHDRELQEWLAELRVAQRRISTKPALKLRADAVCCRPSFLSTIRQESARSDWQY